MFQQYPLSRLSMISLKLFPISPRASSCMNSLNLVMTLCLSSSESMLLIYVTMDLELIVILKIKILRSMGPSSNVSLWDPFVTTIDGLRLLVVIFSAHALLIYWMRHTYICCESCPLHFRTIGPLCPTQSMSWHYPDIRPLRWYHTLSASSYHLCSHSETLALIATVYRKLWSMLSSLLYNSSSNLQVALVHCLIPLLVV